MWRATRRLNVGLSDGTNEVVYRIGKEMMEKLIDEHSRSIPQFITLRPVVQLSRIISHIGITFSFGLSRISAVETAFQSKKGRQHCPLPLQLPHDSRKVRSRDAEKISSKGCGLIRHPQSSLHLISSVSAENNIRPPRFFSTGTVRKEAGEERGRSPFFSVVPFFPGFRVDSESRVGSGVTVGRLPMPV